MVIQFQSAQAASIVFEGKNFKTTYALIDLKTNTAKPLSKKLPRKSARKIQIIPKDQQGT